MNVSVYVDIDQGVDMEKMKVARNEKRKKLHGFSYCENVANFEAFWRDKNFSKKLLFLGSVIFGQQIAYVEENVEFIFLKKHVYYNFFKTF